MAKATVALISLMIAGTLAVLITWVATRASGSKELAQLQSDLDDSRGELEACVDAQREGHTNLADANRQRQECAAALDGNLHRVFRNLHKFHAGKNIVDHNYVRSFTVHGAMIRIEMALQPGAQAISPHFTITFFNKHGFRTGDASVGWIIDEILPGENRVEEQQVVWRFGPPVYWTID